MLKFNIAPSSSITNIVLGLCLIVDGLVRIASLGMVSTSLPGDWTRRAARQRIQREPLTQPRRVC